MNLVEMREDKEIMRAKIQSAVLKFLNQYPDVDLDIHIDPYFEELETGDKILAHVNVTANAKIII